MAFIYRRERKDGTPRYVVIFRDQHGRWRERTAGPRRRDAEALLRVIAGQVAEGTYGRPEVPTFCEFAADFLESKRLEVKPSTLYDYRQVVDNHLLPYFGRVSLSEITPHALQGFLVAMQGKGVSPATTGKVSHPVNNRAHLSGLPRHHGEGLARPQGHPAARRRPGDPRPGSHRRPAAAQGGEEGDGLPFPGGGPGPPCGRERGYARYHRRGRLLRPAPGGDIRPEVGDIDFEAGVIKVVRSLSSGHGFTDLKTASSRRAVPLLPRLSAILKERYRARGRPGEEELVFCTARGTPFDRRNFMTRGFEPALAAAGLKRIRFHDLRHTYASLAIAAGMDPKALQQAMGHSSIMVTMDTYAHLFPGAHERALRRMEAMFGGGERVVPLRPQ